MKSVNSAFPEIVDDRLLDRGREPASECDERISRVANRVTSPGKGWIAPSCIPQRSKAESKSQHVKHALIEMIDRHPIIGCYPRISLSCGVRDILATVQQ